MSAVYWVPDEDETTVLDEAHRVKLTVVRPCDGECSIVSDHEYDRVLVKEPADGDVVVGFNEWHRKPDGEWCAGGGDFSNVEPPDREAVPDRWTLVSLEPLHFEPSILCRECGSHGYIRDGAWVSA